MCPRQQALERLRRGCRLGTIVRVYCPRRRKMDGLEKAMRCGWIRLEPADASLGNSSTSPRRAVVQTHLHNRPNDPVADHRRLAVVRFSAAITRSALSI